MRKSGFYRGIILLLLLTVQVFAGYSQSTNRITLSGFVYEKGSRETLIGVNVYVPALRQGTVSNNYGYYSISLPADSVEVVFSYVGYQPEVKRMLLRDNIRLDVELAPVLELREVVITDQALTRISQVTQMSRLEIPVHQARQIPALLGEKDMFKVLQLMPGVQSGTEGASGFYVRGGGPDQNLIILDDATVYNASHLFGFFSVFNGDAIKNMQLYKGGFPARFGGRLSSVLDIQMKDGNKEKLEGEAGIGLVSSRLTLEGPLSKGKSSFLLSGRRTYIDALTRPLMPRDSYGGYFFYDFNAKVNHEINRNNRLFVSAYFGRDKFFFKDHYRGAGITETNRGGLFWQNGTTTLRWNHIFNDRLFANTSFIFSDYTLEVYSGFKQFFHESNRAQAAQLTYNSGIRDLGLKYDMSWYPLPNHQVRMGLMTVHHRFTPSALVLRDESINKFERNAEIHHSVESGLYLEDEMRVNDWLQLNPGLRLSHFVADGKSYARLEPRMASNVRILPDLSWKLSYAAMSQYVHLLSSTGIGLPTDLWVPSTDVIKPQQNWQLASGLAYDWVERNLAFSLEGYYKKSRNIVGYKEGASFLFIEDLDDAERTQNFSWQENITQGEAWAYGLEFLVQRQNGRLSGWVGYTLSWIQHRFDDLNFGEKFWGRYDRRHDLSVVGIYEINPGMTFSATWVYASGNAYDLATGTFPVVEHPAYGQDTATGAYAPYSPWASVYDKKNSFRAASYQRLDVGLQFHKQITRFGAPVKRTIELGAYNAYSRKNPFFYYWRENYDHMGNENQQAPRKLMQVSIFPIVPSISLNYKF